MAIYRLVGRLLERKAAQDIGRRPAPGEWDGAWWVAVVTAPRADDRRAAGVPHADGQRPHGRAAAGHVAAPGEPPRSRRPSTGWRWFAGRSPDRIPAARRHELWSLDALAAEAPQLLAPADRRRARRSTVGDATALPATIGLSAVVVRFLRAEPLLPPALTPQPWPPDGSAIATRRFDRAFGRVL